MTGDSFLECNLRRKKKQFGFRLGLNAIKLFWCNTDIEMFSAFPSMVHLDDMCFSIDAFVLCCHKVFSLIAITFLYTSAYSYITASSISSCVDSTGCFLGCYDKNELISLESFLTGKGLSHIQVKMKLTFISEANFFFY